VVVDGVDYFGGGHAVEDGVDLAIVAQSNHLAGRDHLVDLDLEDLELVGRSSMDSEGCSRPEVLDLEVGLAAVAGLVDVEGLDSRLYAGKEMDRPENHLDRLDCRLDLRREEGHHHVADLGVAVEGAVRIRTVAAAEGSSTEEGLEAVEAGGSCT
jgi:hypothetical protein